MIDHNDGSVYEFSVWANKFGIAFDRVDRPGDRDYRRQYHWALFNEQTWHKPRQPMTAALPAGEGE